MKLYLESLGCARNQVDSEIMIGRLKAAGWILTDNPAEAETIVVNTCSFIEDAAQESIDVILELAENKSEGACGRLVVAGCLPERYREEILSSLPEVDVFLGTGAFAVSCCTVRLGRRIKKYKNAPTTDVKIMTKAHTSLWFPSDSSLVRHSTNIQIQKPK